MGMDVGYYIYLPPGYDKAENKDKHYSVVYFLHGGRPGSESKSIRIATFVNRAIKSGGIEPMIYVFPNGGPMSWYNYPKKENGLGEDVFVKELIPHIDKKWRTTGQASGRAIEGFSQGGRGTTRIMFKYPALFASAAPGGSGYGPEKRIQENGGKESEHVQFAEGDNAWDLAEKFAEQKDRPALPIMLWVGTKGFNYKFNLKFSKYLGELKVPHEKLIIEGVDHSAVRNYEKRGLELMQFHQKNFKTASK
ncbi:MAG: esterase family protein [Verrucomicrobiales bacterium]|nr:esterase family protein [Verrucomicrobiales bacterium]